MYPEEILVYNVCRSAVKADHIKHNILENMCGIYSFPVPKICLILYMPLQSVVIFPYLLQEGRY